VRSEEGGKMRRWEGEKKKSQKAGKLESLEAMKPESCSFAQTAKID